LTLAARLAWSLRNAPRVTRIEIARKLLLLDDISLGLMTASRRYRKIDLVLRDAGLPHQKKMPRIAIRTLLLVKPVESVVCRGAVTERGRA
jgi:hypothetical protein